MKTKINIINTMLPILGLMLLLLLSPCKVRNFIQAELGLPQTEASNKSKASLSNSNCSVLAIISNTLTKDNASFQDLPAITGTFDLAFGVSDFSYNYIQPHLARNHSVATIPFYILYQNFKGYL